MKESVTIRLALLVVSFLAVVLIVPSFEIGTPSNPFSSDIIPPPDLRTGLLQANCSLFLSLIDSAGLDYLFNFTGTIKFTIFAPNDTFLLKERSKLPTNATKLKEVLLYHFTPLSLPSSSLFNGLLLHTLLKPDKLGGNPQRALITERHESMGDLKNSIFINKAKIVAEDKIIASNGVLHIINSVLLPPPSALTLISNIENQFSLFSLALVRTGLDDTIDNSFSLSLFLPIDEAFHKLDPIYFNYLFYGSKGGNGENELAQILKTHFLVRTPLYLSDIPPSSSIFLTSYGGNSLSLITPTKAPGYNNRSFVETIVAKEGERRRAFVIEEDLLTDNGAIQVVDNLLIPPSITVQLLTIRKVLLAFNFSNFVDLVDKSGIGSVLNSPSLPPYLFPHSSKSYNFTLFVPSNEAIEKERESLSRMVDSDLKNLVLYHFLASPYFSSSFLAPDWGVGNTSVLPTLFLSTSLFRQPQQLKVSVEESKNIFVNHKAKIIQRDIITSSIFGIIHAIDSVLSLPPAMVDILSSPSFSLFLEGLQKTNLVSSVLSRPHVSLLLPSNMAFSELSPSYLNYLFSDYGLDSLSLLLRHHLSPYLLYTSKLPIGTFTVPTFVPNDSLSFSYHIKKSEKEVVVIDQKSRITQFNILTENGVLHMIDKLLFPSFLSPTLSLKQFLLSLNYTLFVSLVERANLGFILEGTTLQEERNFTVFVFSNEAISSIPPSLLTGKNLRDLISYHISPGIISLSVTDPIITSSHPRLIPTIFLPPNLKGQNLKLRVTLGEGKKNKHRLTLNEQINLIKLNLQGARNGLIHLIDNVVIPPPGIVDLLSSLQSVEASFFSKLVYSSTFSSLYTSLSPPFTLFVPLNSAFEGTDPFFIPYLLSPIGKTDLENLLKFHLVPSLHYLSLFPPGSFNLTTVEASNFSVIVPSSPLLPKIEYYSTFTSKTEKGNVVNEDIVATDGNINFIDLLLLPPSLSFSPFIPSFSQLLLVYNCSLFLEIVDNATLSFLLSPSLTQNLTLFIPSNSVLSPYLPSLAKLSVKQLQEFVLFHFVSGSLVSSSLISLAANPPNNLLPTFLSPSLLKGPQLLSFVSSLSPPGTLPLLINKQAFILSTDIQAVNGVLHLISAPLFPPPVILDRIKYEQSLTLFSSSLSTLPQSLYQTLVSFSTLTLFAPSNQALLKEGLGVLGFLLSSQGGPKKEQIMLSHFVNRVVYGKDILKAPILSLPTLHNNTLLVQHNSSQIQVKMGNTEGNVIEEDILAENGNIIIIDSLLIPPEIEFTLYDIAVGLNLSLFLNLIERANLTSLLLLPSGASLTVFIPTNEAIARANLSYILSTSSYSLSEVMKYHFSPGIHISNSFYNGFLLSSLFYPLSLSQSQKLKIEISPKMVVNSVKILNSDVYGAANGIIHVIDNILIPPPSLLRVLEEKQTKKEGNFSLFLTALRLTNMTQILSSTRFNYTLFAPQNTAFAPVFDLLSYLFSTSQGLKDLSDILQYHIVNGTVLYYDEIPSSSSWTLSPLLPNSVLHIKKTRNGDFIINGEERIEEGDRDLLSQNGILHALKDSLLIPPSLYPIFSLRKVLLAQNLTTFVSLVDRAGLSHFIDITLQNLNFMNFTIFSPTNEAFSSKFPGEKFPEGELLVDLLKYHFSPTIVNVGKMIRGRDSSEKVKEDVLIPSALCPYPLRENQKLKLYEVPTIQNNKTQIRIRGENPVKILKEDIVGALNGVVQILDGVLIPPGLISSSLLNLPSTTIFSSLIHLTNATFLLNRAETTLFAPTDHALQDKRPILNYLLNSGKKDIILQILAAHIVPKIYYKPDLFSLPSSLPTLFPNFTLSVSSHNVSQLLINNISLSSSLALCDILSQNGVVHMIEGVLIPSAMHISLSLKDILTGMRATALLSLFDRANLTSLLDSSQHLTLFVPSNEVMEREYRNISSLSPSLLESLLKYHIVKGEASQSTLSKRKLVSTFLSPPLLGSNQKLTIGVTDGTILLNKQVKILQPDILGATNGIIHIIDQILYPPKTILEELKGVVSIGTKNVVDSNQFSLFLKLVFLSPSISSILSSFPHLSLFVPTNQAFYGKTANIIYTYLSHSSSNSDRENVLEYHILNRTLYLSPLPSSYSIQLPTLQGEKISITKLKGQTERINNLSMVLSTDNLAENGVIHEISSLLLPSSFSFTLYKVLQSLDTCSLFLSLIEKLNLVSLLEKSDLTLFAPSNSAITAYFQSHNISETEKHFKDILLYHFIPDHTFISSSLENGLLLDTLLSTMLLGGGNQKLKVQRITEDDVFVNDAKVIDFDFIGTNGVVHIVDKIISIPKCFTEVLADLSDYSLMAQTLALPYSSIAELLNKLNSTVNLTVFLPNNDNLHNLDSALFSYLFLTKSPSPPQLATFSQTSFIHSISHLVHSVISDTSSQVHISDRILDLSKILSYHFSSSPSPLYLKDIDGTHLLQTLLYGEQLNVTKQKNGQIMVNDLRVNQNSSDILISSGVIHSVSSLLLPHSFTFTVFKGLLGLDLKQFVLISDNALPSISQTIIDPTTPSLSNNLNNTTLSFTVFAPSDLSFSTLSKMDSSMLFNNRTSITHFTLSYVLNFSLTQLVPGEIYTTLNPYQKIRVEWADSNKTQIKIRLLGKDNYFQYADSYDEGPTALIISSHKTDNGFIYQIDTLLWEGRPEHRKERKRKSKWWLVLTILLPLSVVALTALIVYCLYARRRHIYGNTRTATYQPVPTEVPRT